MHIITLLSQINYLLKHSMTDCGVSGTVIKSLPVIHLYAFMCACVEILAFHSEILIPYMMPNLC